MKSMPDEFLDQPAKLCPTRAPRNAWASLKLGLRGLCPSCGKGRILSGYLTVNPCCPVCHEEFFHHRADDFPPYITIFVVGHILGASMFAVDETWPDLPMMYHFMIWPTLCIALSLFLLPKFKSGLIAYQWALRMHGFETAHVPLCPALESRKPLPRPSVA
jgi:uncharacterized protein (DUF983 family)